MARRNYTPKKSFRGDPLATSPFKKKQEFKRQTKIYPGGENIPVSLPESYRRSTANNKQCVGCKFFIDNNCSNWKAKVKSEYVCNSWNLSGSDLENIVLEKETYVNKQFKENVDTQFSEFIKPPIDEDIDQFFQIYKEIFYDIPKRGEKSHTSLMIESKDHIEDYVDPKDTTILALTNKIEQLQDQIAEKFNTQEHPFFPDGSILHVPYVQSGMMQNGKLRMMRWSVTQLYIKTNPAFKDQDGNVKSLRKIAIIFDDTTVMDGIPKGKPINKEEDLNDYDFQEPTDILNFNRLRNATSQTDLDSAEILIIKNILDEKENNVNSVTRSTNTGY